MPVLFLAGLGRSGTTLIERTLAETRGVHALGEVMHLWERGLRRNELCACGSPFLGCPFWSEVGRRAYGGWDNVDVDRVAWLKGEVNRARRVPNIVMGRPRTFRTAVDEYVDHYVRVYRAARQLTGDVLVDSSKQVSLAWCLLRSAAVDLRVVHCVRDSRGVAYSWAKQVHRPEAVDSEHELMAQMSSWQVSLSWMVHNAEAEPLGGYAPMTRVRYEDFVRDPAALTRQILTLAGVDSPIEHIRGNAVDLGPSHSCAGNPMRFQTGSIELRPDDAWHRTQPSRQRRTVTSLTAPLLARYGYLR